MRIDSKQYVPVVEGGPKLSYPKSDDTHNERPIVLVDEPSEDTQKIQRKTEHHDISNSDLDSDLYSLWRNEDNDDENRNKHNRYAKGRKHQIRQKHENRNEIHNSYRLNLDTQVGDTKRNFQNEEYQNDFGLKDTSMTDDYNKLTKGNRKKNRERRQNNVYSDISSDNLGPDLYSLWQDQENGEKNEDDHNQYAKESEQEDIQQENEHTNEAQDSYRTNMETGINTNVYGDDDDEDLPFQNLRNDGDTEKMNEREGVGEEHDEFRNAFTTLHLKDDERDLQGESVNTKKNVLDHRILRTKRSFDNINQRLHVIESTLQDELEKIQDLQANKKLDEENILNLKNKNKKLTTFIKSWYRLQKEKQKHIEESDSLMSTIDQMGLSNTQKNEISDFIEVQVKNKIGNHMNIVGTMLKEYEKALYRKMPDQTPMKKHKHRQMQTSTDTHIYI